VGTGSEVHREGQQTATASGPRGLVTGPKGSLCAARKGEVTMRRRRSGGKLFVGGAMTSLSLAALTAASAQHSPRVPDFSSKSARQFSV
jgi:hypothetical protein